MSDQNKLSEAKDNSTVEPEENAEKKTTSKDDTEKGELKQVDEAEQHVVKTIETSKAKEEEEKKSSKNTIDHKDYSKLSLDDLVDHLEKLIKIDNIQRIKASIDTIKKHFNTKFNALVEEKRNTFETEGGMPQDFYFSSPLKARFQKAFNTYHDKRKEYHKAFEKNLKENLSLKLQIIEDIKGLINVEESINTTYKQFKTLQEKWRNIGPIPRDKYNNVWNNYHHHVEIFYDFLHLNRDLRDLDFKHNLDQKLKIIEQAEALAEDENSHRAFRELQVLHKLWKEELGPVAKEHRDEIWERFSTATKTIHSNRKLYFEKQEDIYLENLKNKQDIIEKIKSVTEQDITTHSDWQQSIKEIEALRKAFFSAGKVPVKVNELTWSQFKDAVRTFNKNKNAFYKDQKKGQYENLQKKLELITIAEENKENLDFETVTPLMKKIQNDWKQIGHVPRKDSDRIWNQFKNACNYYFDRLHENHNQANSELFEAFDNKVKFLSELKSLELSGNNEQDLATINLHIERWKQFGDVPQNKYYIEGKFRKQIDSLYYKLDLEKQDIELLKYDYKLQSLSKDQNLIDNEHHYVRKKIDEIKSEINQLENNLQFFSNVDEDNPMVKDVHTNIKKNHSNLNLWKGKLKKIKQYNS